MEIIIGIISGMVTAIGMGGGTVLILLLTLIFGIQQHIAQSVNLIFFVPTSITAIIMNIKNKNIDFKIAYSIVIFGIVGSAIGSIISGRIDVYKLRKCFGIFLFFIAVYEIYNFYKQYIKNKNTHTNFKSKKKED